MATYQARDPRAQLNTLRSLPLHRPVAAVFGPSALSRAIGDYRVARDACDFSVALSRAYAELGRSNRVRPEHRRARRAAAFRAINALRADQRAAWARRDRAEAALLAAGGTAAAVDAEDASRRVDTSLAGFAGIRIEDDSDMAAFLPRGEAAGRQVAR